MATNDNFAVLFRNRQLKYLVLMLFFLCPLFSSALAIGISPSNVNTIFSPEAEIDLEFYAINNVNYTNVFDVYVEGELKDYVTLTELQFPMEPQEVRTFSAVLRMPPSLSPGRHQVFIGVVEHSPEKKAMISVVAGVKSIIFVDVPYPGKYLEASLSADTVNIGDTLPFYVRVKNLGTETINEVSSTIGVFEDSNLMGTLKTNTLSLASQEEAELQGEWLAIKGGQFRAIADIAYDEFSTTAETLFSVGQMILKIRNIDYEDIVAGTIGKISVTIESKWNADISNVYANLYIYDGANKVVAEIQGNPFSIKPLGVVTDVLYWDAKSIQPGAYNGKVVLNYDGQTTQQEFKINVIKVAKFDNLYIIIIILLIIAFIIMAIYLKLSNRNNRKKEKKRKKK